MDVRIYRNLGRMNRTPFLLVLGLLVATLLKATEAQLSKPITHDGHVNESGNRFLQREARTDTTPHERYAHRLRLVCPPLKSTTLCDS